MKHPGYIDICLACFFLLHDMFMSTYTPLFFTFIEENSQQFGATTVSCKMMSEKHVQEFFTDDVAWVVLLILLHPVRSTTRAIRGGGGGSKKNFFSALQAPVWSKNKWGSGPPGSSSGSTTDYPDLGSDMSLVWNFCTHSSDILQGNQW